jgi:hypothetical protein
MEPLYGSPCQSGCLFRRRLEIPCSRCSKWLNEPAVAGMLTRKLLLAKKDVKRLITSNALIMKRTWIASLELPACSTLWILYKTNTMLALHYLLTTLGNATSHQSNPPINNT